jgi:hypothetical protein
MAGSSPATLMESITPQLSIFSAWMKASCGISTLPNWRMRFLPSFFSRSLRFDHDERRYRERRRIGRPSAA